MAKLATPVIFGEVLYDCFPDGNQVLGGAPFNVAWHCQAFGLKPLFISRIGNDDEGRKIKEEMLQWGMNTDGLQVDNTHATGKVKIEFHSGEPVYDIVENSAWDHIQKNELPDISQAELIYHGSLAMRNPVSGAAIECLKQQKLPVFVDINLRPPWWDKQQVKRIIADCKWLKLNEDELSLITGTSSDIKASVDSIFKNSQIESLIVTQGENGVIVCDSSGGVEKLPPVKADKIIDTVGAGDAFSSVFLLGIYCEWDITTTVNHAQQFASAIVQQQGATVKDRNFYESFIQEWNVSINQ